MAEQKAMPRFGKGNGNAKSRRQITSSNHVPNHVPNHLPKHVTSQLLHSSIYSQSIRPVECFFFFSFFFFQPLHMQANVISFSTVDLLLGIRAVMGVRRTPECDTGGIVEITTREYIKTDFPGL